jgi:hypothetical protein
VNIQGKVSSFLIDVLVGPMKICIEFRKLILKEYKIQVLICVCMCLYVWCVHVHDSLFPFLCMSKSPATVLSSC